MEEVTNHVADGVVLLVDGEYRSIGHLKSVKGEQIMQKAYITATITLMSLTS